MRRMHIQRLSRQPARAASASWPAIFFGLACAACADAPFDPVDEARPETPPPVAAALNPATPLEPFDLFDESVWLRQEHVLGRGPLLAANVTVEEAQLHLALSAAGYQGGEIASRRDFGTGAFAASLRCGAPSGALCAFFMYQRNAGNRADEIDIEILGATRTIWFTTWSSGRRTNHASATLPFDPAADTHAYGIVRTGSSVAFYVDGQEYARFRRKLPSAPLALLVNAWWPTWLTPSAGTGMLDVDWIDWS